MCDSKKKLGQYYTENYKYILNGMIIPKEVSEIVEPFAGSGDLLNFINDRDKYVIKCYDIDPKQDWIIKRDTIMDPPEYTDKFILTNPPYLARNKSDDKAPFDKYQTNDLYKCFIKEMIFSSPIGGIIIIPLNFWSSIRKQDVELRKEFLDQFDIIHMNIFETPVFKDTTYTVCSFQFEQKGDLDGIISAVIYPGEKITKFSLGENNNYTIGGELYCLQMSGKYQIERLTRENIDKQNTRLVVKCIDDTNRIKMWYADNDDEIYIDKTKNLSARSYLTLIASPCISDDDQVILADSFNDFLNNKRDEYCSLFLTNYREGNRKRISFNLVYKIFNHVLEKYYV